MAGEPGAVLPEGSAEAVADLTTAPKNPARSGDNPGNYTITDADQIGTGTPGERIRANMAAIRLVLDLEREGRYATREEQAVLVKYVGWGGLKNVFKGDNSASKQERDAYAELKRILTPEQLFWMGQSVLDAHYTSPRVVRAMYRVLEHFGVEGGRFIEPTVGSGNFIGMMPAGMAANTRWHASEIDPLTSLIARNLYPDAQVLTATGFQNAEFAYGRFDVAIGNPPFGDQRITDTNKKRADISGFKIHNYIIAKASKHLRPGGVMAFVVTNRFLDTADAEARAYLAENFRFLGAFRLPNNAFKENAGTEVTTDVVFLQRLREGENGGSDAWLDTNGQMSNEDGEAIRLNRYFAENPEMLLGKPSMQGTMYGGRGAEFTLESIEGFDVDAAIDQLLADGKLGPAGLAKATDVDRDVQAAVVDMNREDVPIGGFFRDGDRIIQRMDDDADGNVLFRELTPDTPWTEKQTLGATRFARILGIMNLRDMAYDLMAAERGDMGTDFIEGKRQMLNERYDAFVKEFGFLNDAANRGLFDDDPRIEFGLEGNYRKGVSAAAAKRLGTGVIPPSADKSSLLRERVFFPKQEVESADTPRDGYSISLSERGRLDLDYISSLTGLSVDAVIEDLSTGDSPLIYRDPVMNKWVQEDEYLSGNVKAKLKAARGAGLEGNVRALEAVQPADVAPELIHVEFGATWVPAEVYEDFLGLLGYANPQVAVLPLSGSVEATRAGNLGPSAFRADLENQDYTIADLFSMVANRRKLVAYDGRGDERVVNQQRTDNLGRIRKKLLAIWSDWVKADPERADKLALVYNETMNTTIERKYDGVRHLRTVGTNPVYRLRNSQKNSAWRMIQSSIVMMDHVVGAGKTMALTTGIMERKRLGLSKKPMVAVPNHLVGQWARDWLALYPGANILAATEKDFSKPNRRRLFARIATGKFDAIIVGHTSLGFIPLSPETETKFVMLEVEHLEKALSEAKSAQKGEKKESRQVRAIKNRIAKRQEKIKELQDRTRDNVASFEDMGIDYLAVDEFHEFKNLEYATTLSNVAGMGSPEGSKKAFDLYMKIRVLQEAGGGIAGATGTPLSNSMVEMYTLLRYLNPGALERAGMEQFDSWVKAFASIDQRDEYTASGNIKARTVMAAFNNLPELLQMYKQVADTVTMTDLKRIYAEQVREENQRLGTSEREDFPVPKVAAGARQLDMGAPTPDQMEFMDYLIARADVLDKLKGKAKQEYAKIDNALWLMNDARKMSLDVRIIDPTVEDHPDNKVNRAARRIKSIYDKWDADLGTQLVFCDLSTPAKTAEKAAREFIRDAVKKLGFAGDKAIEAMLEDKPYVDQWRMLETRADMMLDGGRLSDAERERVEVFMEGVGDDERSALVVADSKFSVYDALKQRLMDAGIPENEIAFIHDANTSERKRELFDLVNVGKVRVLLGSSMKMGAGTNAQKRLVALHHMDAPWRPSDMEQREGRIIRQGNMLYERDPDGFEVEIVAYSTERTFDAQMWGVLARKAGFLEQFRMGLRSIREEGGDADGYAEFMAEATGNQIFRDKIRLERELDDLEAEERSAKMKRQAAENLVNSADSKLDRLNRELEEVTQLAGADFSSITFDGKTYRNDLAEAIESEEARFRTLMAAYEVEHDAYKVARKAWEEAAGTDRGRPPPKPVAPEQPELTSPSFREVSEWARFIDAITKKIELISGDAAVRTFEVTAANGVVVPVQAKRYGDTEVQIRISAYDSWSWAEPARSPKIAGGLTPRQFQADLRGLPIWTERSIRDLTSAVEQSRLTLDRVKPVDPETVTAKRAEYEAVKKAVEDANAVLAAERAQRDNRFIAKDTRRFGAGLKALAELRQERGTSEAAVEAAPELPPIPAGARFRQLRDGETVRAEYVEKPTDVPIDGLEDVTFFASKREATGKWAVTEASTGLVIGGNDHDTRKAAIEAALKVASNMGPEKTRAAIARSDKLTDDQKREAMKEAGVGQDPADDIRASVATPAPAKPRRRTESPDSVRGYLVSRFGEQGIAALESAGTLKIVASWDDLPERIRTQGEPDGRAFYDGQQGAAYLIADRLDAGSAASVLLHEIGEHYGLRNMLGDTGYRALVAKVRAMATKSDSIARMAWNNVKGAYQEFKGRADSDLAADERFMSEVVARLGEEAAFTETSFWRDLKSMIQRFLLKIGIPVSLDEFDVMALVEGSLKYAMRTTGGPAPRGGMEPAFAKAKAQVNAPTEAKKAPVTETASFKAWFGDSKVVDAEGKPLVVYHGTREDFDTFDINGLSGSNFGDVSEGLAFFTNKRGAYPDSASDYAEPGMPGGNVVPAYLSLQNPLIVNADGHYSAVFAFDKNAVAIKQAMRNGGHDGVIVRFMDGGSDEVVIGAIRPEQIKSAIGNKGDFDPKNPDIRASVATGLRDFMESSDVGRKVSDKVADMFHSQKTFNWWHRTVGSQYHKAQVDKDFRGVFTLAQDYLDDVSKFAKEASDRAGRLLPQMEQVQDAVSGMFSMRRDAADAAAIAGPVFQGTLTDKVWTDAELRNPPMDPLTREPIFPALTDLQIELYKEFRAATDKSLDDLAVSEMARLAKASKLEVAPQGMSLRETAQFYYDQFGAQLETLEIQRGELTKTHAGERRLLEAAATDLPEGSAGRREYLEQVDQMRKRQGAERTALDQELAGLDVLRSGFLDKAAKISRLKANGYAPLMRFGQYTIDVFMQATDPVTGAPQVNDKGEPVVVRDSEGEPIRPFFGMFESESEANEAARMLAEDYPDYTIQRGILSQNAYELFKGVTPETVELFGQMIGAENEQAFQSYLKLAVNNRSAMKRLIQRKGMAGFAKDPARVLASFILSNARAASGNWHFGDMMKAAAAIPKTKGDVKDEAVRLLSYVQNPQEEASAVRGILFAQFLGGSIAAAMVNMTQSFTTTFPYLSQFGEGAMQAVADAMKVSGKLSVSKKWQVPDAGLRSALEQATEEGVVSPHEVHLLMGQANPTSAFGNSRLLRNVTRVWGSFFSLAERYNRHVAFIAAWNMAQKQGMSPEAAYDFAKKAVTETQFLYCVDEETECLTTTGWKRRDELKIGDIVIGVDENGKATETPLLSVHSFAGRQKVVEFSNANRFSMVVTEGHRHVVQNYNSRDKIWQKPLIRTTTDLRGGQHLLRVPASPIDRPDGDADFGALLGWIAAEGTYAKFRNCKEKRNVRLVQSSSHNPEYVAEIEALLQRLGGHYCRFETPNNMILFTLKKPLSTRVLKAMPKKLLTWDMVGSMGNNEMRALLDAFAKGDGTKGREGGWVIGQKQEQNLHVLQAMSVLLGDNATLHPAADTENGKVAHLYLHTQGKRTMVKQLTRTTTEVSSGVWCPETGTGTWVARRNGAVFVTGNSKANKPNWARGAVGSVLFTFKTFMVNYMEFLRRLPAKERAIALSVLVVAAGLSGLPGAEDLDDLIDTFGQVLGFDTNFKQTKVDFATRWLGRDAAGFLLQGVSYGIPFDVSARLGMGNIVPGTAIFKKSELNKSGEILEAVGPVGGLAQSVSRAFEAGSGGDVLRGGTELMPKAIKDAIKAVDMYQTGVYKDYRGRKVVDVDGVDAFVKAIGFNPNEVAEVQRAKYRLQDSVNLARVVESDIAEKWARGLHERDPDAVRNAQQKLRDWNSKNPETPINIKFSQVQRRVVEMTRTSADRLVRATPKEMRGMVREGMGQ